MFCVCFRVPTVPVKNLNGSSPVHPALAGNSKYQKLFFLLLFILLFYFIYFINISYQIHILKCKNISKCEKATLSHVYPLLVFEGITGILMSAAGLPVCLTRPPKLVLHPPPVSKSDIKPVPGLGHCCRKTTKKQARKGGFMVKISSFAKVFQSHSV